MLLTQGIHTLDLMLSLVGPAAEATGYAGTMLHRMEAEDIACAAVRFECGAIGTVDATTAAYPGHPERIDLTCTKGSATLTGAGLSVAWADGRTLEETEDRGGGGVGADPMAFTHEGHRAVLADFVAAVRAGRPPRASGDSALHVHRLIAAMLASASKGHPVAVG